MTSQARPTHQQLEGQQGWVDNTAEVSTLFVEVESTWFGEVEGVWVEMEEHEAQDSHLYNDKHAVSLCMQSQQ